MKLTTLLLVAAILQVSAATYAQKVTLSEKNTPLNKVFEKISDQTGYDFIVSTENLKLAKLVNVNVQNENLKVTLDKIFAAQPLVFIMQDKLVVVSKKTMAVQDLRNIASIDINGTVTDTAGNSLAGATIKLKNTQFSTISKPDGTFHINGVTPGQIMSVSFVGYETLDITITEKIKLPITVQLKLDASPLNVVQVVGYGTSTKRLNTGSVGSINAVDIEKQPVTNALSALSGRIPGVFVQTTNGLPGGNINIQIRGKGSLTAGTSPLFIVDGVPFESNPANYSALSTSPVNGIISPLNSLNPADIENISVLKDADATAIYGSRGANGVVLITTKKGKAGADKIILNYTKGINNSTNFPKLLSLQDYLTIRKEAFANDKITPTTANAADLLVWDQFTSTNWAKYLFGNTAQYNDLQAGVSGGADRTTYNVSANYHGEDNVISNQAQYSRGGVHFTLHHFSLSRRFDIQLSNSIVVDDNHSPNLQNSTNGLYLSPNFPMLDPTGAYTLNSGNPLRDLNSTVKSNTNNLISNLVLSFQATKDLQFKVSGGYNRIGQNQTQLFPLRSLQSGTNYAQFGQNTNQSWLVEPQINFNKNLPTGTITVLIGGTYQSRITENQFIKGSNYSNEMLLENIASAATIDTRLNNRIEYKYISIFARATYNLQNKYLLNINARRDGSSRFGPENRFGNFGSVGAAWIFSEESWLKDNLPFLSFGKLRSSYGTTGNDQITDYQYLSTYSSTSNTYQGISILRPARIDNSDFHWETTKKLEFGLELGFVKNRILFNTNFYLNRSSDQLVNYSLPYTTGFISYQANLPAVIQNTGVEFELTTININNKNLRWSSSFNLTIPHNKLVSFQDFEMSSYAENYQLGYDISRVKGYHFLGVDPQTGVGLYADQNGAQSITPYSNYTIGKTSPDLYGGFSNSLNWHHFTLDIFFQFAKQMAYGGIRSSPGQLGNNYAFIINRWQKAGDQTNVPKASTISNATYLTSSANYFNSSYIRLKNLSLGYDIPKSCLQKFNVQNLKLYIRSENLLTFWDHNAALLDPESGGFTAAQPNLPPVKSLVAGIQLTF